MDNDRGQNRPSGSFPPATQPQIVRAQQKDWMHVTTLREQVETVFRAWFGTRWITRWAAEAELLTQVMYHTLSSVLHTQTLGEEYVDIWQYSAHTRRMPSVKLRAALVLFSTLPQYITSRLRLQLAGRGGLAHVLSLLPAITELLVDINLAAFYLFGRYYDITHRVFGIRKISSIPDNPNNPAPSYSLLGILLSFRLLHRFYNFLQIWAQATASSGSPTQDGKLVGQPPLDQVHIDDQPVSALMATAKLAEVSDIQADPENDPHTWLNVKALTPVERAGRKCPLCLEERTGSAVTECGHVFCWTCIVGWGREKAECPLCRQSLALNKLIPIYNL
ncbi:peroxisome biogenesis factor 10 [Tulasnella sp. JGI-2019a]|nr:peroxisome biogenesis factor 10 [Tulasnella sp. JGI-2019a]